MAQNSAGIKLGYYDETASKNVFIPGIKSIPDIGGEPETLETTTLDNLVYTSYIAGLQDLGGSFSFEANLTPELVDAIEAAVVGKDHTWFIYFPAPLDNHYSWTGAVQKLPVTGVGVNEVVTTNIYITVQDEVAGPNDGQYTHTTGASLNEDARNVDEPGVM